MARYVPHDYQTDAIERALAEPTRAALIGSEVGTGKTLLTAEIMIRAGWERVLLIGIPDTFSQWAETIERQSEGTAPALRKMESNKAGRAAYADFLAGEPGYYFAGIQWLQAQDFRHEDKLDADGMPIEKIDKNTGLPTGKMERQRVHLRTFAKMSQRKGGGLDAVIFDEAHQVSNYKSIGRRTLLTFRGRDEAPMFKMALSATWSGNSFDNAWSLTNWLWPELVPAYWNWHGQYVEMKASKNAEGNDVYVGGKQVMEVAGEKNPGEFARSLPLYIKDEAEKAPEAINVYCEPTPQQSAQFAELKAELLTWVYSEMSEGREPLVIDIPAVLHSRLRQVALAELSFDIDGNVAFAPNAASGKLRALKGILEQWGGQPAVLFTDSEKFARLTADRMTAAGWSVACWTGKTSRDDRAQIKADFIAGKIQYIVGTVQSMGTGIDGLQRVCSKAVWLSEPDGNPVLADQALGRVFRPGRTLKYGEFQHVRLLQLDSPDVGVAARIVAKAKAIYASTGRHVLTAA